MDRLFFVFSHFSKKAVYYLNMYNLDFLSQEKKNARESNHVYHEEFEKIKKDGNFLFSVSYRHLCLMPISREKTINVGFYN